MWRYPNFSIAKLKQTTYKKPIKLLL